MNERIVRELLDALNRHDIDAYLKYYADDATLIEYSGRRLDKEDIRRTMSNSFLAFPDLEYIFERMLSQGNVVVVESTGRGTHKGEYHGLSATNNKFELPRVTIYDFEEGKIKQVKTYANIQRLIQQLSE